MSPTQSLHGPHAPLLSRLCNAELFAPERLGRADLLIAAGRIVAVAPRLADPGAPFATLDLEGARVAPGLVDPHVHLIGGGGEGGPATRVAPLSPADLAVAGVTTAVGVLGTDGVTRHPAALLAAVRALGAAGLTGYLWTGSYAVPPVTLTGDVRNDIVYIPEVVGVGEVAISDHRSSQPTLAELLRLAADCHVGGLLAGKRARLHLHVGDGARGLDVVARALDETELPAEAFYPTHVNRNHRVWGQAQELAVRGVVVDVTAAPDPLPEEVSAVEAVERWLGAGLPPDRLTVSSDAGGSLPCFDDAGRLTGMGVGLPTSLPDTIGALVARGHPLEIVLPVFTRNVADSLGLPAKGRIAAGADADLVVLGDDDRPRHVMAGGRWVVRDGCWSGAGAGGAR